jgi:type III secretory pathway component EscU
MKLKENKLPVFCITLYVLFFILGIIYLITENGCVKDIGITTGLIAITFNIIWGVIVSIDDLKKIFSKNK